MYPVLYYCLSFIVPMISFMRPGCFPFADAKVLLFSLLPNYFQSFFQENFKLFSISLIIKYLHNKKIYLHYDVFYFSPPIYRNGWWFLPIFFLSLDCFLRNTSLVRLLKSLSSPITLLRMADNRIRYIHYIIRGVFIQFRRLSQNANIGSASYGYFVKKFLI